MTVDAKDVLKELATIQKEASEYGNNVVTRAHYVNETIVIDLISVPAMLRRTGIGSHILNEYQNVAYGFNISVVLDADSCFGTPPDALHVFYTNAGFIRVLGNQYRYTPLK